MTIDKKDLKAIAEACKDHQPLRFMRSHGAMYIRNDNGIVFDVHQNRSFPEFMAQNKDYADLVLACTPATILALLGEIERHEKNGDAMVYEAGMKAIAEQRDLLKAENEKFDEGMRSLAFQLGAGGYNAETLTAEQLVGKVTDGLASFAESSGRLLDQVRAERDALRSQVATLQAEPNSYQSGYDAGRAAEKAHADNWREEADGLRRDASRYRFLRNQHWPVAYLAVVINPKAAVKPGHVCPSGDRLDEQVDEAMKREASHD